MSKKLYVGNLSFEVKEEDLRELFSQIGTVESVRIITDRYSSRSKGFGFVEMASEEEAQKAMEKFNGYSLKDRDMVVSEAKPRRSKDFKGKRRY